jgi:hypothetical protein
MPRLSVILLNALVKWPIRGKGKRSDSEVYLPPPPVQYKPRCCIIATISINNTYNTHKNPLQVYFFIV